MIASAAGIVREITNGTRSATEPVQAALHATEAQNGRLRALRCVDRLDALEAAKAAGARIAAEKPTPVLACLPVVVKDNVAQAGRPNPAGRAHGAVAPANAVVIDRLLHAGAVLIGRANMDELAYGVTGSNAHTGQILNPWNVHRHPGGSSAGSAAAVASGMALLAIGTDTAGSVRIPAALCGLVGVRPTSGAIPSSGIAPLAHSFDTVGPIAHNVADVALLLSVMMDAPAIALAPYDPSFTFGSLRVAAVRGTFAVELSPAVSQAFARALDTLMHVGAQVASREIVDLAAAPRASGPVIGYEAAAAWSATLAAEPDSFSADVASLLRKGSAITADRYDRARQDCDRIAASIHAAFDDADLLVLPTTPIPATSATEPGSQLQLLALTVGFSISGNPVLTLPMGCVDGLPIGLQLVARPNAEAFLLRAAYELEQALGWRERHFSG